MFAIQGSWESRRRDLQKINALLDIANLNIWEEVLAHFAKTFLIVSDMLFWNRFLGELQFQYRTVRNQYGQCIFSNKHKNVFFSRTGCPKFRHFHRWKTYFKSLKWYPQSLQISCESKARPWRCLKRIVSLEAIPLPSNDAHFRAVESGSQVKWPGLVTKSFQPLRKIRRICTYWTRMIAKRI